MQSCRDDYVHVSALHDFHQMMWRNDAIDALEVEANKHVASQVCIEVIDDVLEWMLEGWVFGERQSTLQIAGYVPSINAAR